MVQRDSVPLLLAGTVLLSLEMACAVNDAAYRDEGQSFVDSSVQAIATNWNADELVKRADPRFLDALPEPKARQMIADISKELGPLKHATPQLTTVGYNLGAWSGKGAQDVIRLECAKGTATLVVVAQKAQDAWRILGFYVNMDAQN